MIRRWCVALLLAMALGAAATVVRAPSLSGRGSSRALDPVAHATETASSLDARVDLVMPARRVVSEGSVKPLLQTLAMLSVAFAVALTAPGLVLRLARSSSARSSRRVPCGVRAPPSLRVA
jgi:hypothetical protein